jgi:hypothetical protein
VTGHEVNNWYQISSVDGLYRYVGFTNRNGLHHGDNDVLRIRADSPLNTSPYNWVRYDDSYPSQLLQGTVSNGQLTYGKSLLLTGQRTGTHAATVDGGKYLSVAYFSDCPCFGPMWQWPARPNHKIGGDSGGTVWRWAAGGGIYKLVGFIAGFTDNNTTVFTSQEDAKISLNLDYWCTTTNC